METGSSWIHPSERGSVPGPGLQNRRSCRPRFLPWHYRTLRKGSFVQTGLSSVFLEIQVTANSQMKLPFSVYHSHYPVNESSVSGCWVWMTWALRLRRAQCSPERSKRASISLFFQVYFISTILNGMFVKVLLPMSICKGPVMSFMALL